MQLFSRMFDEIHGNTMQMFVFRFQIAQPTYVPTQFYPTQPLEVESTIYRIVVSFDACYLFY
jgi:hypothetical protein